MNGDRFFFVCSRVFLLAKGSYVFCIYLGVIDFARVPSNGKKFGFLFFFALKHAFGFNAVASDDSIDVFFSTATKC